MTMENTPTDAEILSCKNVPVKLAAAYLGCSQESVREALKQGHAPFGYALKGEDGIRWSFHISPGRLVGYQNGTLPVMDDTKLIMGMADAVGQVLEMRAQAAAQVLAPGLCKKISDAERRITNES